MAIPLNLSEVPDINPYIQYVASSGQTVFPYPFPITQDSDLICVVNGVTLGTDSGYSLSGQGNDTGGFLTFTLGQTAGTIITLFRDVPIERITQIGQNSGFSSTAFNAEFNNLYLIAQQLEAQIGQCLQVPNTNNPAPTTLLTPAVYANKYLAFDANGNPTPAVLTSSGSLTGTIVAALLNLVTSIAPTYDKVLTAAEIAASVVPTNYAYAPGNVLRYGADPSGLVDSSNAINNAILSAGQGGAAYIPAGTYLCNSPIKVGATATSGYTLIGAGYYAVKLNFNLTGNTQDCVQLGASALFNPVRIEEFQIECNNTGLDGIGLYCGNRPKINRVKILDAWRNGLAIKVNGANWVEKGKFEGISVFSSGLHAYYFNITGAGGAYINECLFEQCEVRGCSTFGATRFGISTSTQRLQLGAAVYAYNGGTYTASSVMSDITFLDTIFDGQRATALANSSDLNFSPMVLADATQTHVVEGTGIAGASNVYQPWTIITGGWETTSGGPDFNGFVLITAETTACNVGGWFITGLNIGGWSSGTSGKTGSTNFNVAQGGGLFENSTAKGSMFYLGPVILNGGTVAFAQSTTAQAITANGQTVAIGGLKSVRVAPTAAYTGIIITAGTYPGQEVTIINESTGANSLTMAASGTSGIADGTSCVISGLTQKTFSWDAGTSLWYHS